MVFPRLVGITLLLPVLGSVEMAAEAHAQTEAACRVPALSRFRTHTVAEGETLDAIAQQYNLLAPTLINHNRGLANPLRPGQELTIPPFNGQTVSTSGRTWEEIAEAYGSRADVLFEINGCPSSPPGRIFVPGIFWRTGQQEVAPANHPLQGYPLPETARILVPYGWQHSPEAGELTFRTGITLEAEPNIQVLAVGSGTVAFVGSHPVYGNLVVINHAQGLQSRYAGLTAPQVSVGQAVSQGAVLGNTAPAEAEPASLFFEIRLNSEMGWIAQDPQKYIPELGLR